MMGLPETGHMVPSPCDQGKGVTKAENIGSHLQAQWERNTEGLWVMEQRREERGGSYLRDRWGIHSQEIEPGKAHEGMSVMKKVIMAV